MLVNKKNEELLTPKKSQLVLSYNDLINMQMKLPNCSLMKEGYSNAT